MNQCPLYKVDAINLIFLGHACEASNVGQYETPDDYLLAVGGKPAFDKWYDTVGWVRVTKVKWENYMEEAKEMWRATPDREKAGFDGLNQQHKKQKTKE